MLLLSFSALVSFPAHRLCRDFLVACVWSGVLASVALNVWATWMSGPDKFLLVALLFGSLYGFITSACVGWLIRRLARP